jgi:uncharacterized repeat protein (TIGR01451 family)
MLAARLIFCRLRAAGLALGLLIAAFAAPAMALTISAPTAGVLPKAAPFTVQWTTTTPAASVSIMLIQVTPTATIVAPAWPPVSNTGQATLSFPASVVCGAGHTYKIGVMVWGQASTGLSSGPSIVESAETKPFRLSCEGGRTETLTIVKTVVSDGPIPPPNTPFVVDVRCPPSGPNTTVTLSSANGYQQVVPGVTVGANCTVTERPPVVPADLARRGCRWETSYPGAGEGPKTTLTTGANTTRRIVNRWVCKDQTGTGTGTGVGAGPGTATGAGTVVRPRQRSDLSIRKTGPTSVNVGDQVTYTLTAFNNGTQPVAPAGAGVGAIVTDAIPAGFSLVSPQASSAGNPLGLSSGGVGLVVAGGGWTCFNPTLTCGYGGPPVAPGSAFPPLVVVLQANVAGSFQQCATIRYVGATDQVAANNRSCMGVNIRQRPR